MTTTEQKPASTAVPAPARPSWARLAPPPAARRWWRPATAPHIALASAFMAAYTLVSALRYARFDFRSWDLAIFTEEVKAYAHLRVPIVPVKGDGFNVLGDHFSPITAAIAPLFRIWPSAFLLLLVQAALFAWSTGVVSDTAARLLGRSRGLCIGIGYGLSFGLQRAIDVDFHEVAFAVPLVAVVCRQLLARRWHRAVWWSLPLLLVKEDLGMTVAAVGLLLLIQGRRRVAGPVLIVLGATATVALVWWVVPHFNPTSQYAYWDRYGGRHPHVWTLLWAAVKRLQTWTTLGWTLGITGLLAARSPLLALAAPTLLWRLTSTYDAFRGTGWQYSAVLMPIAFLAAADAALRIRSSRRVWLCQFSDRTVTSLPAVALACMAGMTYGLGGLAQASAWSGGHVAEARRAALDRIPDGATVEATTDVLAGLAGRSDVYWYGGSKIRPPQYIVFDKNDWDSAPLGDQAAHVAQDLHPGSTYRVVFSRDKVTVVRLLAG
jgi:uncharacterized membrane protein